MADEDLDSIERALVPLVVAGNAPAQLRAVADRFNAEVDAARALVAALRAGTVAGDVRDELRAYAVMYAEERERLVRQWGISRR